MFPHVFKEKKCGFIRKTRFLFLFFSKLLQLYEKELRKLKLLDHRCFIIEKYSQLSQI